MSQKFSSGILTIPVYNGIVPSNGPKAAPLKLDFSVVTEYDLDLTAMYSQGWIDMVQSVFIDNSANASTVSITVNGTGQIIIAPAHTQGYYAILCPNPPRLVFTSAGGVSVPVFLLNFCVGGAVWATQ